MKEIRIAFLVDTSLSMNRKLIQEKISRIDLAKGFVETFLEIAPRCWRHKFQYLLATYEPSPDTIKVDFTDFSDAKKRDIFLDELKNLSAYDLPDATASLSELFRALNYDRCSKDLDTPGYGRYLIKSEPTLIFWITDGQQCLSVDQDNQIISPSVKPSIRYDTLGTSIYKLPWRWDQRVFSIIVGQDYNPEVDANIRTFTQDTGGDVLYAQSSRQIRYMVENCLGYKFHPDVKPEAPLIFLGVQVQLAELSPEGQIADERFLTHLHIDYPRLRNHFGHYPIPEHYVPTATGQDVLVSFSSKDEHPYFREPFPFLFYQRTEKQIVLASDTLFDRYMIRGGPIEARIKTMAMSKEVVSWNILVKQNDDFVCIGFMRYSQNVGDVAFYHAGYDILETNAIMETYNRLPKDPSGKVSPPTSWLTRLNAHVAHLPRYLVGPFRRQLEKWKIVHLVDPESLDESHYGQNVGRRLMQLRDDAARGNLELLSRIHESLTKRRKPTVEIIHPDALHELTANELFEYVDTVKTLFCKEAELGMFSAEYQKHSMPIAKMGQHREVKQLRDALETEAHRKWKQRHAFGNPYALDDVVSSTPNPNQAQITDVDSDAEEITDRIQSDSMLKARRLPINKKRKSVIKKMLTFFERRGKRIPPLGDAFLLFPKNITYSSLRDGSFKIHLLAEIQRWRAFNETKERVAMNTPDVPSVLTSASFAVIADLFSDSGIDSDAESNSSEYYDSRKASDSPVLQTNLNERMDYELPILELRDQIFAELRKSGADWTSTIYDLIHAISHHTAASSSKCRRYLKDIHIQAIAFNRVDLAAHVQQIIQSAP